MSESVEDFHKNPLTRKPPRGDAECNSPCLGFICFRLILTVQKARVKQSGRFVTEVLLIVY